MSELRAKTDRMTGVQMAITYPHHEIHGGSSFFTVVTNESMADNDTLVIAFKTPAGTKRMHMVWSASTLVGCHMDMLEGPSWTQGTGTAVAIMNRYRQASPDSSMLLEDKNQATFTASDEIIQDPTSLSGGSASLPVYIFGDKKTTGGEGGDRDEWIMKPDSTIAIRMTADGGSNKGQIILSWYEHTDN